MSVMLIFMVRATLPASVSMAGGQCNTSRTASAHITLTIMEWVALYMRLSVADR